MKSNKLVMVLSILAAILVVALIVTGSMVWYRSTHVFVEGEAYAKNAQVLDLREKDISYAHFDTLQQKLPQCTIVWSVPFQGEKVPSNTESLALQSLDQDDLNRILRYFPSLKAVNAGKCSDYDMLEKLQQKLPKVQVSYQVSLGTFQAEPDAETLSLLPQDYSFDALMEGLKHLPMLKELTLKTPEITAQQVQELRDRYPGLTIACTVEILGKEYDTETKSMDLSALTSKDVEHTAAQLQKLSHLEQILLNGADGKSQLAMEDAKKLKDSLPGVHLDYTFDFYGVTISTTDEEVKIQNKKIGDEGVPKVRMALDLMENCSRFVLENCQISGEVMAKLREDYRDQTKIVWRIYFGEGTSLTDAEILRSTYNVTDDNSHDLIYLEDVRYMDLGHNEYLDDVPFVAGMKSLEVVIISGAPVHDLTPFENCPNLRILEMANCLYVPTLEPLKACTKLEMLNIGFTKLSDLSPLDDLELTHLSAVKSKVNAEEQKRFQEVHPDCLTTFRGDIPYGVGWRYDENDKQLPWYQDIVEVFGYPNPYNNVGWYLKKDQDTK